MGDQDKVNNKIEDIGGQAKEKIGQATGDEELEAPGSRRPGQGRHQAGRREGQGRVQELASPDLEAPRDPLDRRGASLCSVGCAGRLNDSAGRAAPRWYEAIRRTSRVSFAIARHGLDCCDRLWTLCSTRAAARPAERPRPRHNDGSGRSPLAMRRGGMCRMISGPRCAGSSPMPDRGGAPSSGARLVRRSG